MPLPDEPDELFPVLPEEPRPLADLIKIEDELRDDYDDCQTLYFDADKHKGEVDLVKFSYALAKFDFDLDCLNAIIDQLQANDKRQ